MDILDEYTKDYIFYIVWRLCMLDVLNDLKQTIPYIVYRHGGCCFSIKFNRVMNEIKYGGGTRYSF